MNDCWVGSVWALTQNRNGEMGVSSSAVVAGIDDDLNESEKKILREYKKRYPNALGISVGGWSKLWEMTSLE